MSSTFIFDENLGVADSFQAYSRSVGQHSLEFIGKAYWDTIKRFKKSKYVSSGDLMEKFRSKVEEMSGTKVMCNTEIYDPLTALKVLGGNKKYKMPSDFELIIDDAKKNKESFKNVMELAKKIVNKEKLIDIDDSTELNTVKKKDDAFIYT